MAETLDAKTIFETEEAKEIFEAGRLIEELMHTISTACLAQEGACVAAQDSLKNYYTEDKIRKKAEVLRRYDLENDVEELFRIYNTLRIMAGQERVVFS